MKKLIKKQFEMSPSHVMVWGFASIILLGAFFLTLPVASASGTATPFLDAAFTATSATCVTGLVIYDTATHWSLFGQIVILTLIQIGGLGFMTMAICATTLTRKRIGLKARYMMQESVMAPQLGGIVRMAKFIFAGTFLMEAIGAICLFFVFCPEFGMWQGVGYAVFHSVSAFCNAGFDLMGIRGEFGSLIPLESNVLLNIVIMLLIIIGGLGFFVWQDLLEHKLHFRRYRLHTKIVLITSAVLLFGGALGIFLLEYGKAAFEGMPLHRQVMASLFQSTVSRTAGFCSIDLTLLQGSSILLMIFLMFVGGSPGSTAGGIKTTTLAVIALCVSAELRRKKSVECFGRRIDDSALRHACCVLIVYGVTALLSGLLVGAVEEIPVSIAFFEVVSALATCGVTLGVTPHLSVFSHIILMFLMFFGRVGALTILFAFTNPYQTADYKLPEEKITIG